MLRTTMTTLLSTFLFAAPALALAETTPAQVATGDIAGMTDGEVKKVDAEQKKLTIKHGEIKNLGMPPMTMVFKVKDPAMLASVKAGDKIAFVVEKLAEGYTVMSLQNKQ